MRSHIGWALGAAILTGFAGGQAAPEEGRLDGSRAPVLTGDVWWNADSLPKIGNGKVTIVHFWTFGCINCQHNQPIYQRWLEKYKGTDVQMIGVHTPELENERDPANVRKYIEQQGVRYPVLFDPKAENWKRWQQQWWPAVYLVDRKGRLRYGWAGELTYKGSDADKRMEKWIEKLLAEK